MANKQVYSDKAEFWQTHRILNGYETPWLERFAIDFTQEAKVLDLGCGTGQPIADWFDARGIAYEGWDFAAPMIQRAQALYPQFEFSINDMMNLAVLDRYEGILSWDGFFHLDPESQRVLLPRIARALRSGGRLMMTIGPEAGEATGQVDGAEVYHASLSPAEYTRRLQLLGFKQVEITPEDPATMGRTVLLASKG